MTEEVGIVEKEEEAAAKAVGGCAKLITVGTCNLDQWALDWEGNLERTMASIAECKKRGCSLRIGPELELSGYTCEDHWFETDTLQHSLESLTTILESGITNGILCGIGCAIIHKSVVYNCCIWVCNSRIVLIRPKTIMSDEENYRETRYFTAWVDPGGLEEYRLPSQVSQATLIGSQKMKQKSDTSDYSSSSIPASSADVSAQKTCPIGLAIVESVDGVKIGNETCEEMFVPSRMGDLLALNGCEVTVNMSGSLHQARKLDRRIQIILNGTKTCGGLYMYSNQQGCDGGRLYYDGCSLIALNGEMLAQASQFSIDDWSVETATVDLTTIDHVRRTRPSWTYQSARVSQRFPIVECPIRFLLSDYTVSKVTPPMDGPKLLSIEEEIVMAPACWLWDYLRRTAWCSGFFIPLSGGADSSSTATIVYSMCVLVVDAITKQGNEQVLKDARRIAGVKNPEVLPPKWREIAAQLVSASTSSSSESVSKSETKTSEDGTDEEIDPYIPSDPREFCGRIFHTCYMGTEKASSADTRRRAKELAKSIGAFHYDCNIDTLVDAMIALFGTITGKTPQFAAYGGSRAENLALQNIQARLRMVLSYFLAQLLPWIRGNNYGFLLVLGSSNVDEALRGYMTKYDCSSADINPIGGICKNDLKKFLMYASKKFDIPVLAEIVKAPPTAELEPLTESYTQTDEEDMGMTYTELGVYGYLRKVSKCGPVSMFERLVQKWTHLSAKEIAIKVKRFFKFYAQNRHKLTVLTPSLHFQHYSPDDNRFDHRQFLYPPFTRPFKIIDEMAERIDAERLVVKPSE